MSYREFGSINGYGINLEIVTPEDVLNLVKDNCDPEIIEDLKNYDELADPYRIQNHESHEGHLNGLPAIIHNYFANSGMPFRIEYDIESGDGFIFYEGYFFTDDGERHYTKKEIDDMLEKIASKLHIPCNPDYVNIRWETD